MQRLVTQVPKHSVCYYYSETCFTEEPPSTGSEIEKQLLEAARSGDMEIVKVLKSSNTVSIK